MAITTTAEYKTWAGITISTNDTLIGMLISAASRLAERLCDRTRTTSGSTSFETGTWTEVFNGLGQETLRLRNWPITSVTSVTITAGDGTTLRVLASTEYKINLANGELALTPSSIGRFTSIDEDGFGPGWNGDYGGDQVFGVSPRFSDQYRNITVIYVGGYATVPDDLKMAIWKLVDLSYFSRGFDPTVAAESIGNRSVKYAEGFTQKTNDDAARSILGPYAGMLL